jgi:hypothetical protein
MRALIIGLLAALAIALGAALFWGARLHGELARMNTDAALSRAANGDLESKLTASDKARVAAEASLQVQRDRNIRRMFSAGPNGVPEDIDRFNTAVDTDPVLGPFFQELERRRVMSRYNILLSALQIPPRKLSAVQDLLVQRAIETRRISRHLRMQPGRPGAADAPAGTDRATEDIDVKIETLVGSDAARAIKEWNSAVYSYGNAPDGQASQDAVTLAEAGFTLTNDQLVRLALIRYEVHTENPDLPPGPGGPRLEAQAGLAPQEEKLLAREAEVLSPAEITVLRNWATEERQARAALEVLREKYHIVADRGRVPVAP